MPSTATVRAPAPDIKALAAAVASILEAEAGPAQPKIADLVELATHQAWPAILRPDVLPRYLGVSKPRVYEIARTDPTFPRQIRFTNRCVGWSKASIDEWIAARERKGGAA